MPIKLFVHSFKVSNAEIKVEWVKGEEKLSIIRIKWWFRESEEWEWEVEWYTRWREEDQEQNLQEQVWEEEKLLSRWTRTKRDDEQNLNSKTLMAMMMIDEQWTCSAVDSRGAKAS